MYFVLTGKAPFGDGPGEMILAQQLADTLPARLSGEGFAVALADWLRRGLAPNVEDRFADADEMRIGWRQVVRTLRRAGDARPWWRRLIDLSTEDAVDAPTADW